jgi:SdrD B-like protein
VATTDKTGHFRFGGVAPGLRHVSLDLAQFRSHVRVTTPTEADVEVTDRPMQVHFGVVDFARLLGTVFNDYRNDGNRQSDAPGLAGVTVRAKSESFSTEIRTDGSGDYEIDDLPPGDYTMTIAAADLPSDYVMGAASQRIHVDPLATAILDIPVRALRSISGRVVFNREGRLEPLEGVVITAGDATSTTDADGHFTFRALPAGALEVRVMPVRPVPERLHLPFGVLRMKMDPARVENANVIITNRELIEYITSSLSGVSQR